MTELRPDLAAPGRSAPRKAWVQPTVTILEAGSAELAGGGSDDGVDLS
jgi:hypothetical protein